MEQRRTPNLQYNVEWGRWVLWLSGGVDDESYSCVIRFAYDGEEWSHHRFVVWIEGDWFECVTKAQFEARIKSISEHEGDEVARLWRVGQNQVHVVRDNHPVFELAKHWDAMMQLNLFHPEVTFQEWKGKPLPEELRKEMDAARDRWQKEIHDSWQEDLETE